MTRVQIFVRVLTFLVNSMVLKSILVAREELTSSRIHQIVKLPNLVRIELLNSSWHAEIGVQNEVLFTV